ESTSSNMVVVGRRLKTLAKGSTFREFAQDDTVYYVTHSLNLRTEGGKATFLHRRMQASFWIALTRALGVDDRKTDRQFRLEVLEAKKTKQRPFCDGAIIADGYFRLGADAYYVETDTGRSSFDNVLKKAAAYQLWQDELQEGVRSVRVLWI